MEPFIGQIVMFGGNFAPRSWALCNGQLLSINENQALFSILGTTYGGDGRTTFALPDLRGRAAMHSGTGPGLTPRPLGQRSGTQTNNMTVNQMPSHNHIAVVGGQVRMPIGAGAADEASADGNYLGDTSPTNTYQGNATAGQFYGGLTNEITVAVQNNGASQPINNMQPYLVVNYIIALQGLFPSRS